MPQRIQRRRTKGYRLPPNAIYVGRPTKLGNPFGLKEYGARLAVMNYRNRLIGLVAIGAIDIEELRGKDLACWCRLGHPCHADVLLEAANR